MQSIPQVVPLALLSEGWRPRAIWAAVPDYPSQSGSVYHCIVCLEGREITTDNLEADACGQPLQSIAMPCKRIHHDMIVCT